MIGADQGNRSKIVHINLNLNPAAGSLLKHPLAPVLDYNHPFHFKSVRYCSQKSQNRGCARCNHLEGLDSHQYLFVS